MYFLPGWKCFEENYHLSSSLTSFFCNLHKISFKFSFSMSQPLFMSTNQTDRQTVKEAFYTCLHSWKLLQLFYLNIFFHDEKKWKKIVCSWIFGRRNTSEISRAMGRPQISARLSSICIEQSVICRCGQHHKALNYQNKTCTTN